MSYKFTPERCFSVLEAKHILENYVFSSFEDVVLTSMGGDVPTWFCSFKDKEGRTASGMGKGISHQCLVSAIAEAIEHYHYEYDSTPVLTKTFSSQNAPDWYFKGSPDFYEILKDKTVTFDHYEYNHWSNSDTVLYPCFLGNPSYQPETQEEVLITKNNCLHRYSCNSGVASGLTFEEAFLHGVLESIERDAIGITLIEVVISDAPLPVRIISDESLPKELKQLKYKIESSLKAKLTIYNITSNIKIPSILASLTSDKDGATFFGSGSSLSLRYAIERSMLEALQCVHGQKKLQYHYPLISKSIPVKMLPKYTKCFMDKGYFCYMGGEVYENYHKLNMEFESLFNPEGPVSEQVKKICEYLQNIHDIDVYSRVIHSSSNLKKPWVVQTLTPSLERFYLVTGGHFILPSERGRSFLKHSNCNS